MWIITVNYHKQLHLIANLVPLCFTLIAELSFFLPFYHQLNTTKSLWRWEPTVSDHRPRPHLKSNHFKGREITSLIHTVTIILVVPKSPPLFSLLCNMMEVTVVHVGCFSFLTCLLCPSVLLFQFLHFCKTHHFKLFLWLLRRKLSLFHVLSAALSQGKKSMLLLWKLKLFFQSLTFVIYQILS